MSVLDRAALEASPLADLHAIGSELSIDGYRRLRRAELIDAILGRQVSGDGDGGGSVETSEEPEAGVETRRGGRRGGRRGSRGTATKDETGDDGDAATKDDGDAATKDDVDAATKDETKDDADAATKDETKEDADAATKDETAAGDDADADAATKGEGEAGGDHDADAATKGEAGDETEEDTPSRRRRGRRGGRGRPAAREEAAPAEKPVAVDEPEAAPEDEIVEGTVELLPNGSGFVRVQPPEPSDQDVYISAAQVKRCELVSGDHIAGPRRTPRRSERFASLVRIDTINGRPAEEVADSARFDDLPAAFPSERFRLGSEDPTIKAIEWLTPFGRGSRVTIVGPSRAGKTEALRRLAAALAAQDELQLSLALAGVRPEEIGEWNEGPISPSVAISFALSADAQASAVELVVDQARRVAARGAHAVVLIDTLDGLHPHAARRALAAARNLVDGGSLTVIATSSEPIGGETTVIALDRALTGSRRFPAVDLVASGTIRPELLVGEAAAVAIAGARAEALGDED